ncbi:hypothetical protein [Aggregatilinea lenta]|uniref:hypothetical protein n=1 Tax=Aggregatilinea lenta TaxID=913108 RepID=UPI000E5A4B78|nr:hypothetical protein [Aggregatilinea lenta]
MADANKLAASPMDDMDPFLLEFIQGRINTFIKWDLVRFFYDHPHTSETVETIARTMGRDVRTLEPELMQLVRDGLVEMDNLGGLRIFTLTDDAQSRSLIDTFLTACSDRQFRVKAIYHVIRSLR